MTTNMPVAEQIEESLKKVKRKQFLNSQAKSKHSKPPTAPLTRRHTTAGTSYVWENTRVDEMVDKFKSERKEDDLRIESMIRRFDIEQREKNRWGDDISEELEIDTEFNRIEENYKIKQSQRKSRSERKAIEEMIAEYEEERSRKDNEGEYIMANLRKGYDIKLKRHATFEALQETHKSDKSTIDEMISGYEKDRQERKCLVEKILPELRKETGEELFNNGIKSQLEEQSQDISTENVDEVGEIEQRLGAIEQRLVLNLGNGRSNEVTVQEQEARASLSTDKATASIVDENQTETVRPVSNSLNEDCTSDQSRKHMTTGTQTDNGKKTAFNKFTADFGNTSVPNRRYSDGSVYRPRSHVATEEERRGPLVNNQKVQNNLTARNYERKPHNTLPSRLNTYKDAEDKQAHVTIGLTAILQDENQARLLVDMIQNDESPKAVETNMLISKLQQEKKLWQIQIDKIRRIVQLQKDIIGSENPADNSSKTLHHIAQQLLSKLENGHPASQTERNDNPFEYGPAEKHMERYMRARRNAYINRPLNIDDMLDQHERDEIILQVRRDLLKADIERDIEIRERKIAKLVWRLRVVKEWPRMGVPFVKHPHVPFAKNQHFWSKMYKY